MEFGIFIKNTLVITAVLAVAFLSQQTFLKSAGNNLYLRSSKQSSVYLAQIGNFVETNILPEVSGEVNKNKELIAGEITKQKNTLAQNIWGNIKNYFAAKFSSAFGTEVK